MPMFDDPNKELNRLQEELLSGDELDGLGDLLKDYEPTVLEDREEKPKPAKSHKHPVVARDTAAEAMSDMLLDEDDDYRPEPPRKEKGVGGLIALCVLETVAIVGLLTWWLLCLR